jgi:hypothetical protein
VAQTEAEAAANDAAVPAQPTTPPPAGKRGRDAVPLQASGDSDEVQLEVFDGAGGSTSVTATTASPAKRQQTVPSANSVTPSRVQGFDMDSHDTAAALQQQQQHSSDVDAAFGVAYKPMRVPGANVSVCLCFHAMPSMSTPLRLRADWRRGRV